MKTISIIKVQTIAPTRTLAACYCCCMAPSNVDAELN